LLLVALPPATSIQVNPYESESGHFEMISYNYLSDSDDDDLVYLFVDSIIDQ
jgi:hypothetical protein